MDYEENLIKELKQIKHRGELNSGQHTPPTFQLVINSSLVLFLFISVFLSVKNMTLYRKNIDKVKGFSSRAQGTIGVLFVGGEKRSRENSIAQGTVEYLIIIAVVVVLSLVVVGLVLSSSEASISSVGESSDNISRTFGGVFSVSDLVIDSEGSALVSMSNLSGENVVLKKIVVGSEESFYDDIIAVGGNRSFGLFDSNTNCQCVEGKKSVSCSVELHYVSGAGLEKKEVRTFNVDCMNTVTPSDPIQISGLGSGTSDDPFIINSCKELQRMNQHLDWHYALGGDINCYADTHEGGILWNGGAGFEPVGTDGSYCENESYSGCGVSESICLDNCVSSGSCEYEGECGYTWDEYYCTTYCTNGTWIPGSPTIWHSLKAEFTGSFDGRSHLINNLYINRPSDKYVGLFGLDDSGTEIKNVTLKGANITGSTVGGLIGNGLGKIQGITIENSSVTGAGGGYFGGIVGMYGGSENLSKLYSKSSSVTGSGSGVGGLVGRMSDGNLVDSYSSSNLNVGYVSPGGGLIGHSAANVWLKNSYNIGSVSSGSTGSRMGGLVGANYGSILESYNLGSVSIPSTQATGGLVYINYGLISNSYNKGSVSGNKSVGGIAGTTGGSSSITNSYNEGSISGGTNVGGIIGWNSVISGGVSNSFNAGNIQGSSAVGGVVGQNSSGGVVINSYNLGNVSGTSSTGGVVGKSGNTSSVINSYNTGAINGSGSETGGVVGYHSSASSSVINSFNIGTVSTTSDQKGGLIGYRIGAITNCYWDTALSGQSNCYHPVGSDNCTSTSGDGSDYYGQNGVPFSQLNWDTNWIARDNNYPVLSWQ